MKASRNGSVGGHEQSSYPYGGPGVCLHRYFNRWGGVFAKSGRMGFLLQQRTMKWAFQRRLQASLESHLVFQTKLVHLDGLYEKFLGCYKIHRDINALTRQLTFIKGLLCGWRCPWCISTWILFDPPKNLGWEGYCILCGVRSVVTEQPGFEHILSSMKPPHCPGYHAKARRQEAVLSPSHRCSHCNPPPCKLQGTGAQSLSMRTTRR